MSGLSGGGGYIVHTSTPVPASEVSNAQMPLDWTKMNVCDPSDPSSIRTPRSVAGPEYDECFLSTSTDLTIIGTSGYKVTKIADLEQMPLLTTLILRSHLIEKMENLGSLSQLEKLELYDNQIEALEDLEACRATLSVLDISYNVIRDLAPVAVLENLTELFIANNKIKEIVGLERLTRLKVLDLGSNRIRTIEGLSSCVELVDLWLGKNKIVKISGLDTLTKVRRLDIQSNRLNVIESLGGVCATLEELYLASNGVNDSGLLASNTTTGFATLDFPRLHTIDLSKNRITKLEGFARLTSLEELWLSENGVQTFEEVEDNLGGKLTRLETIYLEHNPLAKDFEYRKKIAKIIPSLTQIDANMINPEPNNWGGASGGKVPGGEGRISDLMGMASMTDGQRLQVMQKLQGGVFELAKKQAGEKANEKEKEKEKEAE